MIAGKTKSGFNYELDENKLRSWEFVTLAKELSNDKTGLLAPEYIQFVLGSEQANALAKHSEHDGYSDITVMLTEVTEILQRVTEEVNAKKS